MKHAHRRLEQKETTLHLAMGDDCTARDLWLAQIRQDRDDEIGADWTEFVKDAAWWLHSEKRRNERTAIAAATGLVNYGVTEEDDLRNIAGTAKQEFRDALTKEGVPAMVCDLLFNKYVNSVETAAAVAVTASPFTPRSKDISNQIAAVFEAEVNKYLDDNFQAVLPGCEFTTFKNREIDDRVALEIDSFSYMTRDTLEPPRCDHSLGIYAVRPDGIKLKKPQGAPNNLADSPGANAGNPVSVAEKCVIGECYSGDKEEQIKGKVRQLEAKLETMANRHSIQSTSSAADITSLFGAALLSFTCRSLRRRDQAERCTNAVSAALSPAGTPLLWRLAQAERLFIVVLSTSEGANTCALREITYAIAGVELGLQVVLEKLEDMHRSQGRKSADKGLAEEEREY